MVWVDNQRPIARVRQRPLDLQPDVIEVRPDGWAQQPPGDQRDAKPAAPCRDGRQVGRGQLSHLIRRSKIEGRRERMALVEQSAPSSIFDPLSSMLMLSAIAPDSCFSATDNSSR